MLGGDDMTQDMAFEALRDEAHMFDHADHSVPLSSCDLGVGDLIMLPVRACRPLAPPFEHRRTTGANYCREQN